MTDGPPTHERPNGLEPALPEGVERNSRNHLVTHTDDGDLLVVGADEDGRLVLVVTGGTAALTQGDAGRLVRMIEHVRQYGTYDPQAMEWRTVRP